jgi:hypothetical protein
MNYNLQPQTIRNDKNGFSSTHWCSRKKYLTCVVLVNKTETLRWWVVQNLPSTPRIEYRSHINTHMTRIKHDMYFLMIPWWSLKPLHPPFCPASFHTLQILHGETKTKRSNVVILTLAAMFFSFSGINNSTTGN